MTYFKQNVKPLPTSYSSDQIHYYDFEGIEFPILFLGFEEYKREVFFKHPDDIVNIAIQSAGYACHQHHYAGWILEPKSIEVVRLMKKLNDDYLDSNISDPTLQTADRYSKFLQDNLAVDCNHSYQDLEEAIYPIDIQYLDKLSNIADLKTFLSDNIEYKDENNFFGNIRSLWDMQSVKLLIFGENCD